MPPPEDPKGPEGRPEYRVYRSRRPLLAGLGVTFANVEPRVFTHLEQRSATVSEDGLAVELLPGFAFAKVVVAGGVATLTLPSGEQKRQPVRCENVLDFAEPRELLRSFLETAAAAN